MSGAKLFIKNEKEAIIENFTALFDYIIAFIPFLREAAAMMETYAIKQKDHTARKHIIKFKGDILKFAFAVDEFEQKFKMENNQVKEQMRTAFKERIEIYAIAMARTPYEMHPEMIGMLHDFCQGRVYQVKEGVLDSFIEYEGGQTIEGLSLIHRHCPHLTAEQKEEFAKDMVKWADFRSIQLQQA